MTVGGPNLFIQLYIDEDVTTALAIALRDRGFIAQSVFEAGMSEADDEAQLTYAVEHGLSLMTHNAKDFIVIARRWATQGRDHCGIIVAEQFSRNQFAELLRQTLQLLDTFTTDEMLNAFIYLSQFRISR